MRSALGLMLATVASASLIVATPLYPLGLADMSGRREMSASDPNRASMRVIDGPF